MATKAEAYAGLSVAITTPFKNGEIDFPKLREQLEFQIAAGTTAVCPAGTTGESPTLTHDENERLVAEVVQIVAGRMKVMAGTGSNSTAECLRMSKRAAKDGADSLLIVAPYYNKPTQEGFYQHYKTIAEQVGLPICVYNIPGRSAKNIEPETIIRMADLPNIAIVKEATGSMDQASQVILNTNLTVLSGDDSITLPLMAIGGRGVVSVVGNIVPKDMVALCKAFDAGNIEEARRLHRKLFPLCRDMLGLSTNPIPIKGAMRMLGRDTGDLRLPMTALTPAEEAKLRTTLVKYGLLG